MGRRSDGAVDYIALVRHVDAARMALKQGLAVVPVGREAPTIEEAGATHDQRTRADAGDAGASIGLLLQPGCDRRVVVVAHRRDDHVVRARGISPVEAGKILRHLDL